ncbi:MAG TPA: alpha-amylase family glycosyl hydrolase [Candidatus Limnocylindrales bacterium]
MKLARHPTLYELNTRIRLSELARTLGRHATLDDITDQELDAFAAAGFDIVWLMGVWQTSEAGRAISAADGAAVADYRRILADFAPADIAGSPFAVRDYRVHADFGGDDALARLRTRMRERGLRLMLDFVPNHVAPDHPWVTEHPDFFVEGDEQKLRRAPGNWTRVATGTGERILALGRDPFFPGWSDTLQLNYANQALQDAMLGELRRIESQCDGVRCDMAMLVVPDVFLPTWGLHSEPFWPFATAAIREAHPGFLFLAEVYWDLEATLIEQGFDYAYDKRLYDLLRERRATPVREHLKWQPQLDHLAHFLENHDEPRAAEVLGRGVHQAAALITYFAPGMRFFHAGQREGRQVRVPVQLSRAPHEATDDELAALYNRLLACLAQPAFRDGQWQLLDTSPAWDGNGTDDDFVAFARTTGEERRLVAVNYSDHRSQAYVEFPWTETGARAWRLSDQLGDAVYVRDAKDLALRGLFLDLPPWAYHAFKVERLD